MIDLYVHPFASFAWKALIAAYERDVPFRACVVDPDHPEHGARIAQLSPTGQFPALVDGRHEVTQSNAVVEYLDRIGRAPPLVPRDADLALQARMLASVFDDYVNAAQSRVVIDALQPEGARDPLAVQQALRTLDQAYAWLATRIAGPWATGEDFTLADCAAAPALFYADWVHPIPPGALRDYRARLLARPSVARVVNEARPYRALYPLGAPDRD